MGVRPEPVVAFFAVATLVAVVEGIERRSPALVGLAVGIGSAGLMAAPTGFVALAPLVAAAPVVWRWFRRGPGGWWAVAGRWVVVLAPAAVGSLLGFGDGAYRDFVRSQEIFAPIQRAGTWYQEITRYGALLDTESHFGSYARRAAVLVCLLMLVWFLVLLVAARARDLVVPFRLPFAGWTALLAFVLLLPTPSSPDPPLRRPRRARGGVPRPGPGRRSPSPRAAPPGAAGPAGDPGCRGRALGGPRRSPSPGTAGTCGPTAGASGCRRYGDFPSVRGIEFDQPLWWALALAVVDRRGGRRRRRAGRPDGDASPSAWRRPCWPSSSCSRITAWMVGDFARAAVLTSSTWSPQVDALERPGRHPVGMAHQIDVLDPGGARALPPARSRRHAGDRYRALRPRRPPPDSPPPAGLAPDVPVFGSFLVPAPGANADARTRHVHHGLVPAPARVADAGLAVSVSGRLGDGVSLRAEYGRADPAGFVPVGGRLIGDPDSSVEWRTVPLVDDAAPPPGAEVVRLVGGRRQHHHRRLARVHRPDGAALGAAARVPPGRPRPSGSPGRSKSLFPGVRQPRQQAGITEPASGAIAYGETPRDALADWTFEPERGGLLGHTHREAEVTRLTTRFRDAGDEVDDLWVLEYRQPYPSDGYELIRRRETVSGLP